MTNAALSTAELFAALSGINNADPAERTTTAWKILRQASASDFGVAVDFALERDLIPLSSAAHAEANRDGQVQNMFWINPVDGSQMVWISPGPFLIGRERVPATAAGFYLARFPVTNAQFARFVQATGYAPAASDLTRGDFLRHWSLGAIPAGSAEHPVVYVSLVDAIAYCRWASLDLPSEWLWEKAARGPDGWLYPWGGREMKDYDYRRFPPAKLTNIASSQTKPVGSYPQTRTAYGCEDLVGNVSEWCLSLGDLPASEVDFGAFPSMLPDFDVSDPELPLAIVRGACFLRHRPGSITSSHRRRLSPLRRNRWTGFRAAIYPQ